jgi:hypothetical protein
MANAAADNAKTAGDILVWTNLGANTPVVYSYTCPVDTHKVVSAVHLGYDGSGTLVDSTPVCPLHDVALTAWKSHDVS